jgi:hypothetical protein
MAGSPSFSSSSFTVLGFSCVNDPLVNYQAKYEMVRVTLIVGYDKHLYDCDFVIDYDILWK